jgi:molecular chaperone GrpE
MEHGLSSLEDEKAINASNTVKFSGVESEPANPAAETPPEKSESVQSLNEFEVRVKTLEEENSLLKDQYLRKLADFENYRRRIQREEQDSRFQANRQLILDILPIIDDFERALNSAGESRDFAAFYSGVALIEKQFVGMLERKWGLKRFESIGSEFNPDRHEAILSEEKPEQTVSLVIEDYQKGFLLNEKVLRPSKVKVSVPARETSTPAGQ